MLGGNQFKKDSNRLTWSSLMTKDDFKDKNWSERSYRAELVLELKPMEIRSFIITLVKSD